MKYKTIEELTKTIDEQNKLIAEILNENAEKENMIEVLFQELKLDEK